MTEIDDLVRALRAPTTFACVQPTHLHTADYAKGRELLTKTADALESAVAANAELRAAIERITRVDNNLAAQLRASIENNAALKARADKAVEVLVIYSHDGQLQTLESREEFRAAARSVLDQARG